DVLERVRLDVLAQLRVLARAMGGRFSQTVADYFLFTALGFVIGPRRTILFGIGDGLVGLNGDVKTIVAPDNAPPYLGYGLVPSSLADETLPFVVHASLPTADVQSLFVGTDGVGEVPSVVELWRED